MSESNESRIKKWLKENRARGARLLQLLVQENSTRGNESSAQAIVIEKCRQLGLLLDIWEIGGRELTQHPAFCCDRQSFEGNPNLVAVLKGSGGGKSIILNGHIDVVPVGDESNWRDDPFSGKIESGKLIWTRGNRHERRKCCTANGIGINHRNRNQTQR